MSSSESLGLVVLPESPPEHAGDERLIAAMLEGCFQTLGAGLFRADPRATFLLASAGRLRFQRGIAHRSYAVCSFVRHPDEPEDILATVMLIDEGGENIIFQIDGLRYRRAQPHLLGDTDEPAAALRGARVRELLRAAPPEDRQAVLRDHLHELTSRILMMPQGRMLDVHQPLHLMGLDSMMALQLRNKIQADLNADIAVATLLDNQTLAKLAESVLLAMGDRNRSEANPTPTDAAAGKPAGDWVEGEL